MDHTKIQYPWIRLETIQATTRWSKLEWNPIHARTCGFDYTKAIENELIEPLDDFQKLKIYLAKGKFEDARKTLGKLKSLNVSNEALGELFLDDARLCALEARWTDCIHAASTAIAMELPSITNQALHQVRSIAYYETQQYSEALIDIQVVEELMSFFTESQLGKYATATKVKILTLLGESEKADSVKATLWNQIAKNNNSPSTLDWLLSLFRLEIDLRRINFRDISDLSQVTYQLAARIGDELYTELALLDCQQYEIKHGQELQFMRTKLLYEEVHSKSKNISTTANIIRNYNQFRRIVKQSNPSDTIQHVFLDKQNLLVHLDTLKIEQIENPQYLTALRILAQPCSQENFAKQIWGIETFEPEVHVNNLRVFLHRIKKQLSLPIASKNKTVKIAFYKGFSV